MPTEAWLSLALIGAFIAAIPTTFKVLDIRKRRRDAHHAAIMAENEKRRVSALRSMQKAAGIFPGMPRHQRRLAARDFARRLEQEAIVAGHTSGMPRAERRRRRKMAAAVLGAENV